MKLPERQSGQALLVILLVMFVALTVSLTVLFHTTTDIKLSRELDESSQAFSAAEAGVEEGLLGVVASGGEDIASGVRFDYVVSPAGEGSDPFSLGKLEKENAGTLWLANYGDWAKVYDADTITLCWRADGADIPDMEAIVVYKEGSDYKVARHFLKSGDASGGTENCGDPDGTNYPYQTDIALPTDLNVTLLALRLKPIGADAFVSVDPPESVADNSLPSQGKEVVSTGRVGDTVRKIRVVKSYPVWPEIFDYVLFSGGGLTK